MGIAWNKSFKSRYVIGVGLLLTIVGLAFMDSPNERLARNMGAVASIGEVLLFIGVVNWFFNLFKKKEPKEPPVKPPEAK